MQHKKSNESNANMMQIQRTDNKKTALQHKLSQCQCQYILHTL